MKILMNDSSGNRSLTATIFVIGFIILTLKLIFSSAEIGGFTFEQFSASEYAIGLGALGAIYVLRRADRGNKNGNN